MSHENFNLFIKEDPNNRFVISGDGEKVTITGLTNSESAYMYRDMGVDFFDGDFEHLLEINGSGGPTVFMHSLSNVVSPGLVGVSHRTPSFNVTFRVSGNRIYIDEVDGVSIYTDWFSSAAGTDYFLKFYRDLAVGTYGILCCEIYSDSARTILLDTLSITLHSSIKKMRYVYAPSSTDSSPNFTFNGFINQLDLQLGGVGALVNGGLVNKGRIGGGLIG